MEQQQQDDASPTNPLPKKQQSSICEECKESPSKYKCPGCSLRSCSLTCVKAHKQRTSCTGKRSQAQFVPLSQFDDNLLLSDYNFLEEMKRVAESAQRMRTKLCAYPHFRLPYNLQSLRRAAANRRTRLLLLPSGMSKREKNQSRYDQRKKLIFWTIEWQFHSTDVIMHDHGVHEDTKLFSIIEKHLRPGPWSHQLRKFCEENLDSLKFFIRKYPKGPKSPFCELDIKAPLRQQLANITILEYPVIHVFLPSLSCDVEVKDVLPVTQRQETKNAVSNHHPSPEGVAFREEEIEDNCSPDPQVYDFMNNVILSPPHQGPHNKICKKALDDSSDGHLLARVAAGNSSHPSSRSAELGTFANMGFDFDQGLIDAYSDLIAEINPDDFLDLEGEFAKEAEVEERKDLSGSRGILFEELEEGEIAE